MTNDSSIKLSSVVVWSQDPLAAEIDGEIALMSVSSGRYFGLDVTGSDVWRQLAQPVKIADLCASLSARYRSEPGTIEHDVLKLIAKLHERQLVKVQE